MAFTMAYGWATPIAHPFSALSMRRIIGGVDGCATRRQGRCPGKEFCADCASSEGCLVDGTLGGGKRRPR